MGKLLDIARKRTQASVYLIHIKNSRNDCLKVGFTRDLSSRLLMMPDSFVITLLDEVIGTRSDMYRFERFIHRLNDDNRYIWRGRIFSGYTELYRLDTIDLQGLYNTYLTNGYNGDY